MKTRILMVCLGNICRSPLAEGILKSKVDPNKIFVDSAGTAGYHVGNMPDIRSIAVAQKYGIDIHQQKSRKFTSKDFNAFDIIYAMDNSNYSNIISLAKNKEDISKVKCLLSEINIETKEVPDPYYDEEEGFEIVFQLIEKACEAISKKL
ncbi:low molecular weight protein-tyrosine-phosphatase [uncultured Maribacter sp.]|uniref:low molecular weight protein-tyrosine-phosphatase n=1 Tax=uncultured Maribacter sp. TaxID=431308 RepID=UPI002605B89D|nr:low molecular weight protein-tyrosine-phosphatase [uncultured Maribacter sp.]